MSITSHTETLLHSGVKALNLTLPKTAIEQYLHYLGVLAKWNQVYNLTAVREIDGMVAKHILDCLAVVSHVQGETVLDVGTGAGLPGLIIAIAHPAWHCVLLDSNSKKTRFVQQAVAELQLTNVEVIHSRIEAYAPGRLFNTVTSRAYSDLTQFYQQTRPFCAQSGMLLAMKGVYPAAELAALGNALAQTEIVTVTVPQLPAQRHIVKMWPT